MTRFTKWFFAVFGSTAFVGGLALITSPTINYLINDLVAIVVVGVVMGLLVGFVAQAFGDFRDYCR